MELMGMVISLLLIAFFGGIEIAFLSANKLRVELLKEKGSSRAKIIWEFNQNPSRFISAMLIGLNIGLVVFGSFAATFFVPERFGFAHIGEGALIIIQTLITTFIILIFGELIPKLIFRINSDQILLNFAYPAKYIFYLPLSPLSGLFNSLSRRIIKLLVGSELVESKQPFTKEDLEYLVKETVATTEVEHGDEADHLNTEIFERALYLKDIKVRNCMVPRMEIHAIELSESIELLQKKIAETKLSRILVYQQNIDKIVGYAHHFDLLKKPLNIKEIVRAIPVVPESTTARDLLLQFIKERTNIAWVVDEYGGTSGIITLEDLMEEIFGEIADEHDEEEFTEKKISEREFHFSGRLEVDYLNQEYNLDIPEGDYETLGGYILNHTEDIPDPGEIIDADRFSIKILKASGKKIELVQFRIKEEE